MPRTWKAAIIGLGGFSRAHALAYSRVPSVRVVAACDLVPEKHAPWLERVRDLIRAIETGREPRCSGREGRADLEVAMAIYESERTGGLVRLPLKRKTSPLPEMTRKGGYGQVTWRPAP